MIIAQEQQKLSKQLARKLLPLAVSIFILISIFIPVCFFVIETNRTIQEATSHSHRLAFEVRKIASQAGNLWQYQATKYAQVLNSFVPGKNITSIIVFDEKGSRIKQYEHAINTENQLFNLTIQGAPAPILFNNRKIGEVMVLVSGETIIIVTILIFFAFACLGFGLALIIYRFPLSVVVKLEEKILENQDLLEHKVEERTSALKTATEKAIQLSDEAQAANRAKSQFLANMSHEIRTPMNGVIGMAELLSFTALNEEQRSYVNTLQNSGEGLLNILNNVLDFSKIEAGKLELQTIDFNLQTCVQDALRLFTGNAFEKKIELVSEFSNNTPLDLRGDRDRLRQILTNLIGNAIKFTEAGKILVHVSFKKQESEHGLFYFEVSDTGIGIPPENQETIFDAFSQADGSSTRKHGGTGLGLTISRQLAEMMGGKLYLTNSTERGSTFGFFLPFTIHDQSTKATTSLRSSILNTTADIFPKQDSFKERPFENSHILVAENNATNLAIATKMLELLGCHVISASNGKDAFEKFSNSSFDLVLMNCQLPFINEFVSAKVSKQMEILKMNLSQNYPHRQTPLIALTTRSMDADRAWCLQSGMDDCLSKPFNTDDLFKILQRWLPQKT